MRAPAAYEVIPCCGDALLDKLMVVSKIEKKNTKCQNYTRHACAEDVTNVVSDRALPRFGLRENRLMLCGVVWDYKISLAARPLRLGERR